MVVERVAWRWVEMRFAIPGDGFEQRSSCNLKNREVDLLLLVALHRSTLLLGPRTDYIARYTPVGLGFIVVYLILSSRRNIDRI